MIDQEQLQLIQQQITNEGGANAYESLYKLVFLDLYRFANSIIRAPQLAEEIVSDVLVAVWRQKPELYTIKDFRLYLYVSIRNTALNYLKSQKRRQSVLDTDMMPWDWDQATPHLKSDDMRPDQILELSELRNKINSAIHQLPPKCRLVYQLIKEEGLKYREAAELLKVSVKTIENQMHIALHKLHKALG